MIVSKPTNGRKASSELDDVLRCIRIDRKRITRISSFMEQDTRAMRNIVKEANNAAGVDSDNPS